MSGYFAPQPGGGRESVSSVEMKRRTFLQTALTGTLAVSLRPTSAAQTPAAGPRPVPRMPTTPFDAPAGSWTLVVLPDTQFYSQLHPEVFRRQTGWIVSHREAHQVKFVAHEGDITQRNTPEEWREAQSAMKMLHRGGIPYAILPGNHDLGKDQPPTARDRFTHLNEFFDQRDYSHSQAFGVFEQGKLENSWHEFSTPTGMFLLVALEYGPRHAVLDWANRIVAARRDRKTIILTHAYLYFDSTRYDWERRGREQKWNPRGSGLAAEGDANDGEAIWVKLASRHPNIEFVLSGHVLDNGTGYLASAGHRGRVVHQILANYQRGCVPDRGYGGGGFLRLMQFWPDGKTVQVKTYSPWYDQWLADPENQFSLSLEPARV